jgi:hypothetical protein
MKEKTTEPTEITEILFVFSVDSVIFVVKFLSEVEPI